MRSRVVLSSMSVGQTFLSVTSFSACLKSNAQRDYGYAVRCEAVASPRRQADAMEWGYAPKRLYAEKLLSCQRGRSPTSSTKLRRGRAAAAHRTAKPR